MRNPLVFGSPLLAALALASSAHAADWYVSPLGNQTSGCTTRAATCSLGSAASGAVAGDTVILMDGIYKASLFITATGSEAAWLTFKADDCATPIIEGTGPGPADDDQSGGVSSTVGQYLKFEGIVARGWNIGFGNGWAGGVESDEVSNGYWDIEHCISYSNGRTGFTFFSAPNLTLKHSISAHNGSSTIHSWSSGVTLFEATGTNLVEGNISFENTERQQKTDGNGFIVDEQTNGATFINNLAFGNAGSCLRLTSSSGTKFLNNTCYHNSQFGSLAVGPTNPSEIYFTNGGVTLEGVTFMNNVIVGTGQAPAGSQPIQNQPTMGWSNNVVATGAASYFTAPDGMNPSFLPSAGETTLTGKATAGAGVPTDDVGFDPKCLVKRAPVMVGAVASETWWQYDVDIDYIKSIGGVKSCFNPSARTTPTEIGAYKSGAVTTVMPGMCTPAPDPGPTSMGGTGGTGGEAAGGTTAVGGDTSVGGVSAGGAPATGGTTGGTVATTGGAGPSTGGTTATTGGTTGVGTGGTTATTGGAGPATGGTTSTGTGGATAAGGTAAGATAAGGTAGSGDVAEEESGCGCRIAPAAPTKSLAALGLFGLGMLALRRRRQSR